MVLEALVMDVVCPPTPLTVDQLVGCRFCSALGIDLDPTILLPDFHGTPLGLSNRTESPPPLLRIGAHLPSRRDQTLRMLAGHTAFTD
jgi:hypothetical protein